MSKQSKEIVPLPFAVYFGTMIIIVLIGLADSAYLAVSHYRVHTDIGYNSFCAISKAFNCDTVSQSPYATFLNLPVAVWGFVGYALVSLLLIMAGSKAAGKKRIWSLIFWIAAVFCSSSLILALISSFLVRSYCVMCMITYAVNFLIWYYAWMIRRRFSTSGLVRDTGEDFLFLWKHKRRSVPLIAVFLIAVGFTWGFFPKYWIWQQPQSSAHIPTGMTESGHPWIGSNNPVLDITEFTDYQCWQCKKMHFFLRQLIAENPTKIRVIHRHYPMDHKFNPIVTEPFHEAAGNMALLAVYAARKNKFWEMNDFLYQHNDGQNGSIEIKD